MSAVIGGLIVAGVGLGLQVHSMEQQYHAAKQTKRQGERDLKQAKKVQKAEEVNSFNSTQRAGRIAGARNLNSGRQGTILGGGVNLSNANQSTSTTPTKTLLGM